MNISSSENFSNKVRCFDLPSIIIIPLRLPREGLRAATTEDIAHTLPMPDFERKASNEMSESSGKCDKPMRWHPMVETDHTYRCSVPRCPLRQASDYNLSDSDSCFSQNSASVTKSSRYSSDCEHLAFRIDALLKDLENGERWESSAGGSSSQSAGRNLKHYRCAGSRCSADLHQSIKNADLPRRPRGDQRWSSCAHEGSCNSLPKAASECKSTCSTTRRLSLPQMPRRQKSNV